MAPKTPASTSGPLTAAQTKAYIQTLLTKNARLKEEVKDLESQVKDLESQVEDIEGIADNMQSQRERMDYGFVRGLQAKGKKKAREKMEVVDAVGEAAGKLKKVVDRAEKNLIAKGKDGDGEWKKLMERVREVQLELEEVKGTYGYESDSDESMRGSKFDDFIDQISD